MNFVERKYNSLVRYVYWHYFSKKLNLFQIVEYPKSGGTWMTQLISKYLDTYYPRNVVPKFKHAVIHGHYKYSDSFNKIVYVVRDGRDIMVSYYFHYVIGNSRINPNVTKKNRDKLPFEDHDNIKQNLPLFIEYLYTDYLKGFNKFSWSQLNEDYYRHKDKICIVRYEDMLTNTALELEKALIFLGETSIDNNKLEDTVNAYNFKNQTKRKPGEEDKNSFLRKGVSGDWKNHFTKEAAIMFDKYAGQNLIDLGYEKDRSWIDKL